MVDLDQPQTYQALDKQGMGRHLVNLPAQCRGAWEQAQALSLPPDYRDIDRVVVAGMGGSAIGGDLAAGLAALEGKLMLLHRNYGPLPCLTPRTLAVFSSYSGNTQETLSSLESSLSSPAKKLIITSGGELGEKARRYGIPCFPVNYSAPPRAAIGYSFIGLLGVLCRLGFVQDKGPELGSALAILEGEVERLGPARDSAANPAKALAGHLCGRLAVIYGAGFLEAVARRWKTQVNENAKAWAFAESLPELNHNSVVGYAFPPSLASSSFAVLLSSPHLPPPLRRRLQITGELLERAGVGFQMVEGQGESPLSQLLSLLLLGDFVSYYLSMLYQTDPTPTPPIVYLKERMEQYGLPL